MGSCQRPSTKCRSEWQTPEQAVFTITSPARGSTMSTSSTVSGFFAS